MRTVLCNPFLKNILEILFMFFGGWKEKFLKSFPYLFNECCQFSSADNY